MTPTAAWYQQTAVLDVGSTVAGLLAVVATVWAAVYAARPGRALLYLVRRWRPPVRGEASPFDVPLAAGRLVVADIQLRGGGRQDIPSAAFDAGRTINIGVNGSILTLLTTSSFPAERAGPDATVSAGRVQVGPGLIGRKQVLTYRVLAEILDPDPNHPPRLTVSAPLVDVRTGPRQPFWVTDSWMFASAVLAPVCFLGVRWFSGRPHLPHLLTDLTNYVLAAIGLWMLMAILTVLYSLVDWVRHYYL